MKKLILSAITCSALVFQSSAQTQIGVGVNGFYATQRPSNVDIISASGGFFHIAHNFKLNKNWNLEPQIQLGGSKLIMDGLFYKSLLNEYEFVNTSASVKQSYLQLYSVRFPVHLKYALFKDSQGKPFGYLGAGPYAEYIALAKQYYKIGNDNFKGNAPIQNKFNYGLSFELSLYGNGIFKNGKNPFSLHVGGMYQMSEYLKDKPSFTPFMPYIKLGINL
ncbi:MAG TPA: hypothetical protein PKX92_10480 [Edaphocola sp.]|nr:hypothetical protein [Edaphocola sp.]